MVSNKLAHTRHNINHDRSNCEFILTEVFPRAKNAKSIFILNVYSSPKHRAQKFRQIFKLACNRAGDNPMIVAGDFNAPNTAWGYVASRAKGKDLLNDADELDLMLITNAAYPTRTGNSVNRDTTPDLTFVRNVPNYQWNNLFEDLGSDHHIVETMIDTPSREPRKMTYVDWDKFREFRHERRTGKESIEQWTSQLKADVKAATQEIETDLPVQSMDSRLAHMLEAKQSLTRRW